MTVPTEFEGSALDNGTRLSWEAPEGRPQDADDVDANLVGYEIFREAYLEDSNNPLLTNNPTATIEIDDAAEVSHRDLGLSYGVTYTYQVRAVFEMTVPDPDDEDETITITVYSAWSDAYTLIVADSGGRLEPLLDPPGAPVVGLTAACDNSITVSWMAPEYAGTAPATDENGVYVGPDYIGGEGAGKEEVGEPATITMYQLRRFNVDTSKWEMLPASAIDGMSYTENDDGNNDGVVDDDEDYVAYGNTYKYEVRAKNSGGLWSQWAPVIRKLEEPDQPLRPSSLVATHGVSSDDSTQAAIILQWDAPEDDIDALLWRTESDVDVDNGNISKGLDYRIQRKIGTGAWVRLTVQPHQYAQDMSAEEAINNFRTQRYEDTSAAGLGASAVSYRVSALVHGCNPSPWNLVDEVEGEPQMPMPGNGSGSDLAAPSGVVVSSLPNTQSVSVTWTSGANAQQQIVALFNADVTEIVGISTYAADGNAHTFTGVAPGMYRVVVASFRTGEAHVLSALATITVQ
jgi:hypothetical protein